MPVDDRLQLVRDVYKAFASADREFIEESFTDDFTYEMTTPDGSKGRNTEILTFSGERICATEVYFGWDVN
jgi:ketosteroid isomerase-like protein